MFLFLFQESLFGFEDFLSFVFGGFGRVLFDFVVFLLLNRNRVVRMLNGIKEDFGDDAVNRRLDGHP